MTKKENKRLVMIRLNFFGPLLKNTDLPKILDSEIKEDVEKDWQKSLLESFFDLSIDALSQEILERYVEATTSESHTPIVPYTEKLSERLLEPLRSAKKNYCLGEYLATMALCGMVAEMLVLLLWEINDVTLKGKIIGKSEEKRLFGRRFDDLHHVRRLEIIRTIGFISEKQFQMFEAIRKKRNVYIHAWTVDLFDEKKDALYSFKNIFQLFMEISEIGLTDSQSVKINPKLLKLFKDVE